MLQFTKLRLAGFKSFVDPQELLIEPGLTGIVGPNGCGKSNLIEALRWVMGETSAKQMRGGEMDDVIFAGTSSRPGRDIAEVVLELDNAARTAPPPYVDSEELLVSRRIERAKGSTYRLNGREIRARDVHLLFADAASGARSAAMVTQGQVAQIVSAKPSDRRALLEEAAGIVGLQGRRQDAELRLRDAEANLARLDDVLVTLDAQARRLEEEAKRAGRYRELSAGIRKLEAKLLWWRWQAAETEVDAARLRVEATGRVVVDAVAAAAAAAAGRLEAADRLPALRTAEGEAAVQLQRLLRDRDLLEAEERRAVEDAAAARARLAQIEADMGRERGLSDDAGAALERLGAERARLSALREREAEGLAAAEEAVSAASEIVNELDGRCQVLTERLAAGRARRTGLIRARDEEVGRIRRLTGRRMDLERQRAAAREELERLPDPGPAAAGVEAAEEEAASAREALEVAEALRAEASATQAAAAGELRRAEAAAARLETEAATLADVLAAGGSENASGLFDRIDVPSGLEAAVSTALGEDVLAGEDPAAPAWWRRMPPYGDAPPLPEGAVPLLAGDRVPEVLLRRIAQIGLVASAEDAERLQPELRPGQRLVSAEGGLWRWDGHTRAAGAPDAATVRLRHKARLEALEAERPEVCCVRDEAAERHDGAAAAVRAAAAAEQQARARLKAADAELARARTALSGAMTGRARLEQRLAGLDEALDALEPDTETAEARRMTLDEELESLQDDGSEQAELDGARGELGRRRAALAECRTRHEALQREAAGRARRLHGLEDEARSWTSRREAAAGQMAALGERLEETGEALRRLESLPAEIAARRSGLFDALAAAEAARRGAGDELAAGEAALSEAERLSRSAEQAAATAREEQVRAEAAAEQAEHALRQAVATIADRLDVRPADLPEIAGEGGLEAEGHGKRGAAKERETEIAAGERRLDRMRRDREQIGPVNLRADIEKAELDERTGELRRQSEDLVEAIARLRRGMAELDREGRDRLRAAFTEIDQHFQTLFHRLFGGGQAHLSLSDPDDPLVAGLDIMASPPGKKLQLMSLLSGGEQTLTALALRFAMFLQRPAPICVLDEVDAPLDDANVDRLCDLLRDLAAGGTRFLVITHHRLSMARMDRLFGVTMAERGASRLVSVDLRAAEVLRQTA